MRLGPILLAAAASLSALAAFAIISSGRPGPAPSAKKRTTKKSSGSSSGKKSSSSSKKAASGSAQKALKTSGKPATMASDSETASTSGAEHKSKLEEQAKAKGDLSYSYWAKNGVQYAAGDAPQAKKLTEEEAAELQRQASGAPGSAWNAAGTFEERNMLSWAQGRLKETMREWKVGNLTVTEVNNVTGDCTITFARGKKRCGFDLELDFNWSYRESEDGPEIKGSCKVANFASDDPEDMHLTPAQISAKAPAHAAAEGAALRVVAGLGGSALQGKLGALLEELKQK